MDNEPVYVPRSTMVDIIYRLTYFKSPPSFVFILSQADRCFRRGDDELLANRHRGEELIELPSGARQRKIRGRIFEPSSSEQQMPTMAGSNSELSELRRRRGGHQATKESMVADQESKQKQAPDLKVFNHAICHQCCSCLAFAHL